LSSRVSVGRHANLTGQGFLPPSAPAKSSCRWLIDAVPSVSGCSFADSEALAGGLLLGEAEGGSVGLLDVLGLLIAVELNVAVA